MPIKDPQARKIYDAAYRVANLERISARTAKWQRDNIALVIGRQKKFKSENPELAKARQKEASRKWYLRHKEVSKKRSQEWRNNNRVATRSIWHRRRARLLGAPGRCSNEQWIARVEYYGWRCFYCHCELKESSLTQDHRIPLSKGGSNWPANLVPACLSCNSKKGAKKELTLCQSSQ